MNKDAKRIIAGAAVVGVLILTSMGVYTIETGEVGVVSTAGKYALIEQTPGLNFKVPFVQGVRFVDTKQVVSSEVVSTLDVNNLPISIHVSFKWRALESQASEMLATYGNDIFNRSIRPTIREVVRNVIGNSNGEDIAKNRQKISLKLEEELRASFSSDKGKFFDFIGLDVREITLDKLVMDKIKAVQGAKQQEKKLINEVLQKKQEAKKRKIDADTSYYEKKKSAEANAISVLTNAKAQAKANKLVAASLSRQLIENNKINRWNGALPRVSGSDNMSLFIPKEAIK